MAGTRKKRKAETEDNDMGDAVAIKVKEEPPATPEKSTEGGASSTATASSKKRKAKKEREDAKTVLSEREGQIRYGALEIVAAYTKGEEEGGGKESKSTLPYGFVELCNDVMYDDDDSESALAQWLDPNDDGTIEIQDATVHAIGIGSLICAVTNEIIEYSDGTYRVPDVVHARVSARLERQLSDDYDLEADDNGGQDYEKRARKKRRIKVKKEPRIKKEADGDEPKTKPGRKAKVKEEPTATGKHSTKRGKREKAPAKGRKPKLIPRPDLKLEEDLRYKKTGKIDSYNGDTHRASKEVIRAYLSGDTAAFKEALKDKKHIADIFAKPSCDQMEGDVLECAVLAEDKETVRILWKEAMGGQLAVVRPLFPECTLLQLSSGKHRSRYADYNRYQVGASRGGKEGNNAFIADMCGNNYTKGRQGAIFQDELVELLRTRDAISIPFMEFIDKEFFNGNMVAWGFDFHRLVTCGHRELAQYAMKFMLHRGVGLNQLHVDTLSAEGRTLDKFRSVSVVKMTQHPVRFCPVHCAASNPNPTYLQQLLEVSPEAVSCVDSQEAGLLHYAAVGEKPDTLMWLLGGPGATLNRNAKLRTGEKTTPLMWAAQAGRAGSVRALCDGQESVEMFKTKDGAGRTALHHVALSSRKCRLETAKALLACGGEPNIRGDARLLNKQTPSMICAARGDLDLLKVFVDGGADITLADKLNRTHLMFASKNGHIHIMSYLLQAGVDVEAEDSSGNTAMHYACAYGWSECAKLLVEVGAPPDPKNSWSSTPLEIAVKKGRFACAILMLKEGVDVNVRDKNGLSLFNSLVISYLGRLAHNNKLKLPWAMRKIMERQELDVACADSSGQTVLHYIAEGCSTEASILELVDQLLARGAKTLKRDKAGVLAVELALKNKNWELCLKLIQNVSHAGECKDGENLMHLLMSNIAEVDESMFMKLFTHLHECNSEWVKQVDGTGLTPLMIAAQAVRAKWNDHTLKGKGKEALENLLDRLPERVGDARDRLPKFRKWSNNLIKGGEPSWEPREEFANGSRTVLHDVLQCPDVEWALRMCRKALGHAHTLCLKTNDGKNAATYALDTFVNAKAPLEPTLKLLRLLHDGGADMNTVTHPLFSSLVEAQTEALPDSRFDAEDCKLDDAIEFVRRREQRRVKEQLADVKKRSSLSPLFRTPIHILLACPNSCLLSPELLEGLIKECGILPGVKDIHGNAALHLCPQDPKYFEKLIAYSDVNAMNDQGETPLIRVSEHINLVELLINSGADVNVISKHGTALHFGVHRGKSEVVELLIDIGADLDIVSKQGTALHVAVLQGKSNMVELLLKAKCNINATDGDGRTALHHAIAKGAVSSDEMLNPIEHQLLIAGANVNAADKHARTPIHYAFFPTNTDTRCKFPPASSRDPIDMITSLAGIPGIDFDKVDEDKRTPLHYAAAVGASICVLYLCENSKKSINSVDLDNNTPLALALSAQRADTVIMLIGQGSVLDVQVTKVTREKKDGVIKETNKQVQSTLWNALTTNGHESVARYMLAAKKFSMNTILKALLTTGSFQLAMQQIKLCTSKELIKTPDKLSAMTGLHYLAQVNSFRNAPDFAPALADVLIKCGIPVSAKCTKGRTALHMASFHGHTELCRHLISAGADVDLKDLSGQTPLSSFFTGENLSEDLLSELIDASMDARISVNITVDGKQKETTEDFWRDEASVEKYLLGTANDQNHTEEAYIQRLEALQNSEKTSKKPIVHIISSTLLIECVKRKNKRFTNALLSYGADGAKVDGYGRTALHHAVMVDDSLMLSLILKWGRVPLNEVDIFGRSALTYAVLSSKGEKAHHSLDLLLECGADPLAGSALLLALQKNKQEIVENMLYCTQRILQKTTKVVATYKPMDVVWVMYGGLCACWRLATVVSVGSSLSVLPDHNNVKLPLEPKRRRYEAIEDISDAWVRKLDMQVDVTEKLEDVLVSLLSENNLSEKAKQTLVKEHKACEIGLEHRLCPGPTRDALFSRLSVGDVVGYMKKCKLHVSEVISAHPNGQYDIQLFSGELKVQVSRIEIRPLRKELHIPFKTAAASFGADLVHACVRPVEYGSFDNLKLLRALVSAGAPADGKNSEGKTPLDRARPGSEIQAYLREVTQSKGGRPLSAARMTPSTDGINVEADANAEHAVLHDAGADNTERVMPKVSDVCELDSDGTSVLANDDEFFDVALSKVDVEHGQFGKYVFYKMQIVSDPIRKTYVLLTNWGRIGEEGKYQQTPYTSQEECIKEFCKVFKSKTGNAWKELGSFKRVPGKYSLVKRQKMRLKHPEKLLQSVIESSEHLCSLPSSIADAIRHFLDINTLTSTYSNSGINEDQLPFGQLSFSTIQASEAKLAEVKEKLKIQKEMKGQGSIVEIRSALEAVAKVSSEFYELLPMGGDQIVTPFQTGDRRFGLAVNLIRLLRDLTITKQLLLGARHRQASMNPIDYVYKALQVRIRPLGVDSIERKCLMRFVDNTCEDDNVIVHQIYALDNGKPACGIPNKRLLFHGSKNENILGILKHGLLIAPPEAPATGWAFGKGVYFADQFSKSLGYTSGCHGVDKQPRSFVFVAEVALGESYKPPRTEYMEKSPEGTSSTHALGAKVPDESLHFTLDSTGGSISLGKLAKSKIPNKTKNIWTRGVYRSLTEEESLKIETLRLDPKTEFPKTFFSMHHNVKNTITLCGPNSSTAEMRPTKQEEEVKNRESKEHDSGEEMEEDSEDNIRIDMSQKSGSDAPVTILHRRENNSICVTHSEFIVYDTKQIRLKYLIEVTSVQWVKKCYELDKKAKDRH